jgi:hypothetical protein
MNRLASVGIEGRSIMQRRLVGRRVGERWGAQIVEVGEGKGEGVPGQEDPAVVAEMDVGTRP